MLNSEWWSDVDVARYLGVSRSTVVRLAKADDGQLAKAYIVLGNVRRWHRQTLHIVLTRSLMSNASNSLPLTSSGNEGVSRTLEVSDSRAIKNDDPSPAGTTDGLQTQVPSAPIRRACGI